jgi:tRNA-specific 2-thiouridylase
VGTRDHLSVSRLRVDSWTWVDAAEEGTVEAQYRAHGDPVGAEVSGTSVTFEVPQQAVAPGQTVALYRGERVLGSGTIVATER